MDVLRCFCILFIFTAFDFSAQAGIVVTGTRIIYPAEQKEVSVKLKNTGTRPALVQSWIDLGDPLIAPDQVHAPFIIMPPITRIDGGKGQTLRLVYTNGNLPKDRESVFWLNVLAVPPKITDSTNHQLNVAYQTRIKLFYRPSELIVPVDTAPKKLQWKQHADKLTVYNPTPYYISLVSIEWLMGKEKFSLPGEMIAPFSTQLLTGKIPCFQCGEKISFDVINDQGALTQFDTEL